MALYKMKANVNSKAANERLAALNNKSVGGDSQKDDLISTGNVTTAGALSTQPTVVDRNISQRGRGRGMMSNYTGGFTNTRTELMSPDYTTMQHSNNQSPQAASGSKIVGPSYQNNNVLSHTQRTRGKQSPKFFNLGRGHATDNRSGGSGNDDSSLSRGFDDRDADLHKFKTITLHEDDEFYQAYINRRAGSPMGFLDYNS